MVRNICIIFFYSRHFTLQKSQEDFCHTAKHIYILEGILYSFDYKIEALKNKSKNLDLSCIKDRSRFLGGFWKGKPILKQDYTEMI